MIPESINFVVAREKNPCKKQQARLNIHMSLTRNSPHPFAKAFPSIQSRKEKLAKNVRVIHLILPSDCKAGWFVVTNRMDEELRIVCMMRACLRFRVVGLTASFETFAAVGAGFTSFFCYATTTEGCETGCQATASAAALATGCFLLGGVLLGWVLHGCSLLVVASLRWWSSLVGLLRVLRTSLVVALVRHSERFLKFLWLSVYICLDGLLGTILFDTIDVVDYGCSW